MTKQSVALSFAVVLAVSAQVADASSVNKIDPNDTFLTAQNIDAYFSLDFDPFIGDPYVNTSTTVPHATVNAMDPYATNGTHDWYSFTVPVANSVGYFDIDFAATPNQTFDSYLELRDSLGNLLAGNDDTHPGDPGTTDPHDSLDSFISYVFTTPGVYEIGVGGCCNMVLPPAGQGYLLHVSVEDHPVVPEPTSVVLLGGGLIALATAIRRRRAAR